MVKKITRGNSKVNHRTHYYKGININIEKDQCKDEKSMSSRINNGIIIIKCPDTCEFFEKCITKSGEVKSNG